MSQLNFIAARHCEIVIGLLLGVMAFALFVSPWRADGQGGTGSVATVSAASFAPNTPVAPESIAAAFGSKLATRTELANSQPLPKSLAGTTVRVNGELAPLFFVSEKQVNFLIPPGTPNGSASIVVTSGDGMVSQGTAQIATVAPALFTANSNGLGPLASQILRVKANGELTYQQLSQYSESEKRFVTKAFDFGEPSDQLFLVLYLTGIRQAALSNVRVNIGGVEYAPSGLAPVSGFTGLDQINVPLPRNFGGRGSIKLLIRAAGAGSSNEGEFEIGSAASSAGGGALQITRVPSSPVLVTEEIEISGSGFAANPLENTVLIVADDGVTTKAEVLGGGGDSLRVRVPFGAGAGQIRVSRGQSEASAQIQVRTSVSGFVQEFKDGARVAVVGLPIALREPSGRRVETITDANGSFVLRDAVASPLSVIDLAGQANGVNYPAQTRKMTVRANRDNQYKGDGDLANIIEIKRNSASASASLAENIPVNETVIASEPNDVIRSGPVTFDTNNSTITFPGGGSGQLGLTVLDPGRTPSNLPAGHFSSTIAQITPFGAKLNPGGKLSFPNSDAIPAGTKARLFKFDQTIGQETVGQFIDAGEATVSADGQRIETAPNAITEASYYFVSIARPLAAINGRVLESDGRPAPRAVVNARGQSAFTDGFGGFVLRNVPVLKSSSDRVKVEVSYQRPDGTISRKESGEVELTANQLATVKPEITLDQLTKNFPPVILAPASLTVTAGEPRDFDLSIVDPDSAQPPQVTPSGNATTFATLANQGNGLYRLRLSPGANATGSFTLTLAATDSAGDRSAQNIAVTVNQPDNSRPTAQGQSATTPEDASKQLTLTGRDPGGRSLNYIIVTQPPRGSLSGAAPNLTYSPARDFNGVDSFTFKASNGSAESQPATVFIAVTPVNDAPVLNIPAALTANAGEILNLVVSATDVDGDQGLKFAAAGLPPGAVFAEVTGTSRLFSWTPTAAQAGRYAIGISVTDSGVPAQSANGTIVITSDAKWSQTSGPEGGIITSIVSLGTDLLASTYGGGVFRSSSGGLSWTPANSGLTENDRLDSRFVHALAANGPNLVLGTNGRGAYFSNNNGHSWTRVRENTISGIVYAFASSGNNLFAAGNSGLFRSTDFGQNWTVVANGLPLQGYQSVVAFGSTVYAGGYRSADQGQTWSQAPPGFPQLRSRAVIVIGANIFAGVTNTGVLKSTDNGVTWTQVNNGLTDLRVTSLAAIGSAIFAATQSGKVFISTNNGESWTSVSNGLPQYSISFLHASGSTLLAGTPGIGIYLTTNNGQSWAPSNTGFSQTVVNALAVKDRQIFAGTQIGVATSFDNGQTWASVSNGLAELDVRSFTFKGDTLFAGTFNGAFRSTDRGRNWTPINNGLTSQCVVTLAASGTSVFAGTYVGSGRFSCRDGGVLRTRDDGQSWFLVGFKDLAVNAVTVFGSKVFVGTGNNGAFRSDDDGQSWVPVNNGLIDKEITTFANIGPAIYAVSNRGVLFGSGGYVYRTNDEGQNWTLVSTIGRRVYQLTTSGASLFAATDSGVFISTNNGQSWSQISSGLSNRVIQTLGASGADLIAGTGGGGAFLLSNSTQNWTRVDVSLTSDLANAVAASGNSLFVGTVGDGIFRSRDQGRTWRQSNNGLPSNANIQSIVSNGATIWAALFGDGVYRSTDDGNNWAAANNNLANRFVNQLFLSGATLCAGTDGGVFRSLDGGGNWSAINTNLSNLRVVSFASNAGVVCVGTIGGGVFRLNPDGVSWTRVSNGLTSLSVTALGVSNGVSNGVLYAGTSGGGICISRDGGDSWTAVNNQLPSNLNVYGFAVSGKKVYAGSIYGVFVSEDEGQNWKQVNAGLLDVYVTGLAVSGDQLFASTASGGVFVSSIP